MDAFQIDEPLESQPTIVDLNFDVKPDVLGMSGGKVHVWLNKQPALEQAKSLPPKLAGFEM